MPTVISLLLARLKSQTCVGCGR